MIAREHRTDGFVAVTFGVQAGTHQEPVTVAGTFNDWDVDATPMLDRVGDLITATVVLPMGRRFAFRYRSADGRWFNDEAADDYEENEFGGANGVVVTEPPADDPVELEVVDLRRATEVTPFVPEFVHEVPVDAGEQLGEATGTDAMDLVSVD